MSQVVVTEDNLKSRRVKSGEQEKQIDLNSPFKKWLRSDITGFDPILAVFEIAVLPIVLSWYIIGAIVKYAIYVSIGFSRLIGSILGNTKAL
jgi:hypothetical protein